MTPAKLEEGKWILMRPSGEVWTGQLWTMAVNKAIAFTTEEEAVDHAALFRQLVEHDPTAEIAANFAARS